MDKTWLPGPGEEKIELFKQENGQEMVPQGSPSGVRLSWARNCFTKIKENINKMGIFFNREQSEWWTRFLDNPPTDHIPDWDWPVPKWDIIDTPDICEAVSPSQVTPLSHVMQKERQQKRVS